ncbi:MAG TPA: FAD-dependent thymidylate synthase [Coprothermobacter proteolyticus]|uniref:FAD-dependent thymidylate synthase n=1 Tax=Coprothermobacter proteolyticus TaxID=35786 RepID=UPI000D2FA6D1|nr:FAD-dependent thymidylate synthase [Coprothermobacter proteolyticus]HOA64840.1 FAD-dependent thymidylate synthase [Coprothermobacter proteolyticus]HOK24490.1 FAD-dependent thymidylate synthase [Coprothermobacter proteolyticus]HOL52809.1 FAD-dependent thymidylate synthase [Coprothermobacter proteolyticus]HOP45696.1 FAD-dependent thymidylate synthase [Coprothermobacter proteolyticus]HPO83910.1 FAD-dependent thymidylate synthase [Coprothermobacter proteolyticus]
MSDIKVKLLSWTNDPEKIVGYAARICYSAEEPLKLLENLGSEQIQKSIRTVKKRGHLSVLEHASFTFLIDGCSRVCTHQLVRHRLASYSQRSQRYVNEEDEGYVVPNTIAKDSGALEAYQKHIDESKELYKQLLAMGIPKEDARFVIPQSVKTTIVVTMNARELLHFFGLRMCRRAQWEIREVAALMLNEVKKVAPTIFEDAGPECISKGFCPEGNIKCYEEVKQQWKS